MSKTLIIAEKPSLAQKIVGAIGGMTRKQDYYEGQNYIVTSVFGHLLTLYDIEDYTGEKKKSWSMEDIPFFPEKFKYKIKMGELLCQQIQFKKEQEIHSFLEC